jgi:hypothetical protein
VVSRHLQLSCRSILWILRRLAVMILSIANKCTLASSIPELLAFPGTDSVERLFDTPKSIHPRVVAIACFVPLIAIRRSAK